MRMDDILFEESFFFLLTFSFSILTT